MLRTKHRSKSLPHNVALAACYEASKMTPGYLRNAGNLSDNPQLPPFNIPQQEQIQLSASAVTPFVVFALVVISLLADISQHPLSIEV